jgi:hypothetical protein
MKRDEIITVLIAIVVLWALWKISKLFSAVGEGLGKPENAQTGGSETVEPNSSKLTYPLYKYKALADQFEGAVWNGLGFYEDDDAMEFILSQMNNDDDFIALSNAYGVRGRGLVLRDYYNLPTTITNYMDTENKMRVNDNYAAKGMTTRI